MLSRASLQHIVRVEKASPISKYSASRTHVQATLDAIKRGFPAAAKVASVLGALPGPATLVRGMKAPPGLTPAAERLTEREQEVMLLVARGANNSSILSQLGLRDRTQIAVFAHQQRAEQG